jgi:hypothetical protein
MKTLCKIYEFLFDKYIWSIDTRKVLTVNKGYGNEYELHIFIYKLTNKFNGSVHYIIKKYKV